MIERLEAPFGHASVVTVLRTALYGWCLLSTAMLLAVRDQVWGPRAIQPDPTFPLWIALDLLGHPGTAPAWFGVLVAFGVVLVLGIVGIAPRMTVGAVWLLYHVLMIDSLALMDGGDQLVSLQLTYLTALTWIGTTSERPDTTPARLRNTSRNLLFLCLRVQVAAMYLGSAAWKLEGTTWPAGQALYYIVHSELYSTPLLARTLGAAPSLMALGTVAVLTYQLVFPVLVWFAPARRWLLGFGTAFHLSLVFGMGLASFGTAVIVTYLAFLTEHEACRYISRRTT